MATVPDIPNEDRIADYTATAAQDDFTIPWVVIADSQDAAEDDIRVEIDGVRTTDFSFAGTAITGLSGIWNGGSITLDTPCVGGERVIVYSERDPRRTGYFLEGKALNMTELDKLMDDFAIQLRDLSLQLGRALKVSITEMEDGYTADDVIAEITAMVASADASETAAAASAASAAGSAALVGAAAFVRPFLDRVKSPPTSPTTGDRYLIHRTGTTGAFVGKENQGAEWDGSAWVYTGAPIAGQIVNVGGDLYQYRLGREDEAAAVSYFWRAFEGRKVSVAQAPTVFSFGDSIFAVPNTTDCFVARVAAELGGTNDNQAVSGTGIWNAAHHVFAKPKADTAKGNYLHQIGAGHNNCVYTADTTKNATTIFHELMAILAYLWGDFTPASSLSTVGAWTTDTGDALGVKPIANQSGAGSLRYSTSAGAQLNGNFTGERFILHALRGDGVSANRCADIGIVIDGSTRTPFNDAGDFEYQSFEATHIGHAVLVDNKWGKGSHAFTLTVGANVSATRPAYIDGITSMRPPAQCTPVLIHLPLRPTDLTPTTAVGAGTAKAETFRAAEAAIRKALAYFPEYPWAIVDPNGWVDGAGDFADAEHPNAAGANRYMWAVQDRIVKGEVAYDGSYTPGAAASLVNVDAVTPGLANWSRNGNTITVWGSISIDPTASGSDSGFTLPLPVPSNLANSQDLAGVAVAQDTVQQTIAISGHTADDKAWFLWRSANTAALTYRYHYSYRVK